MSRFNTIQRCIICHQPGIIWCHECQRHLHFYQTENEDILGIDGYIIARHYDRMIQYIIHHLKYYHVKSLGSLLGSKLATIIQISTLYNLIQKHNTIITSVPIHRYKQYFIRGYNQSQLIAQQLSHDLHIPYQQLLRKSFQTISQSHKNRKQRTITQGGFTAIKSGENPSLIIIIDDVMTTGSTIQQCAVALKTQWPKAIIRAVCIARNK